MKAAVSKLLQSALNRYLALDPESEARLHELEGKRVTLEFISTGFSFQLFFNEKKIELITQDFLPPDTTIKGTPLTLFRMTLTTGDRKQFFAEDVSIEGDLDVGQNVMDLFDRLEIDWEEYVSRWVGDVPSHQVGRLVRRVKKAADRTRETILQNVNEYVHEEIDMVPPVEALQDFFNDVDGLRMDVDRIAARIALLKKACQEGG